MKRSILLLTLLATIFVLASGVAWAITNGKTDGTNGINHPYVGALLNEAYPECSGTLISPKIFLTAAHCELDPLHPEVFVTFDPQQPSGGWNTYKGTFVKSDRYDSKQGSRFDVAVVRFDDPGITPPGVDMSNLPKVPSVGELDSYYHQGQAFTAVGYGSTGKNGTSPDTRMYATSLYQSVGPVYLKLTQNVNKTKGVAGGTCSGDSGGPNFVGAPSSSNPKTIAGITNTGDTVCGSTNTTLRLDTPSPSARDFVLTELN